MHTPQTTPTATTTTLILPHKTRYLPHGVEYYYYQPLKCYYYQLLECYYYEPSILRLVVECYYNQPNIPRYATTFYAVRRCGGSVLLLLSLVLLLLQPSLLPPQLPYL